MCSCKADQAALVEHCGLLKSRCTEQTHRRQCLPCRGQGNTAAALMHASWLGPNPLLRPTPCCAVLQVVQLEGDKAALVKHVGQLEECCAQLTDQLKDVKGKWASSCMSSVKLHKEMQQLRRLTGQPPAPSGELWSVPQYSGGSMGQAKHDLAVQVRRAQCGFSKRGLPG